MGRLGDMVLEADESLMPFADELEDIPAPTETTEPGAIAVPTLTAGPSAVLDALRAMDTGALEEKFCAYGKQFRDAAVTATEAHLMLGLTTHARIEKIPRGGGRGKKDRAGEQRGALMARLAEMAGIPVTELEKAVASARQLIRNPLSSEQWANLISLRPVLAQQVLRSSDTSQALSLSRTLQEQGVSDNKIRKRLRGNHEEEAEMPSVSTAPESVWPMEALPAEMREIVTWLCERKGLSVEAILENAIRDYGRREGWQSEIEPMEADTTWDDLLDFEFVTS